MPEKAPQPSSRAVARRQLEESSGPTWNTLDGQLGAVGTTFGFRSCPSAENCEYRYCVCFFAVLFRVVLRGILCRPVEEYRMANYQPKLQRLQVLGVSFQNGLWLDALLKGLAPLWQ